MPQSGLRLRFAPRSRAFWAPAASTAETPSALEPFLNGALNMISFTSRPAGFRGNKAALPCKPCVACGRAMSWRRRWAKNWAEVKYCSDPCRRARQPHG
jgi:hypothetical protein